LWWGNWYVIFPFLFYSVIYASTSDSRWHEAGHGTAFRTDWMNKALYEIASFMVFRQSIPWQWSHVRHHSDTIIRGRDPEIAVPRPPVILRILSQLFVIRSSYFELGKIIRHAFGKIDPAVATYLPESEYGKVFFRARIYLLIYATVISLALYHLSFLPLMFIGFPTLAGSWLMLVYGLTQHAGLAENVLDHRLNCRTVYMNRIHRYLYWNMNYHVEHHMFPLVPYHALPKLHELIKGDCPTPYKSIPDAYREIIPTLLKQRKDTSYFAKRVLPANPQSEKIQNYYIGNTGTSLNGWVEVCPSDKLKKADVLRFDYEQNTYAVYRTGEDNYFATDGICTHGNMHLSEGLVIGNLIECAKHNGRFNITDGSVQRKPVCVGLKTFPVEIREGQIFINTDTAGGIGAMDKIKPVECVVISNSNVATYVKELVLEPSGGSKFNFRPGEYIQLEIPPFEATLNYAEVQEPFKSIWINDNVFHFLAKNSMQARRNYSLASNPDLENVLRLNVRLALPPEGKICNVGIGSTYVFNLMPGDKVKLYGPYGNFHIRQENKNDMIYIGSGAGMGPLRSHISYLLETLKTDRKIVYWYGAKSKLDLYYTEYFRGLTKRYPNFSFHQALSRTQESDGVNTFPGYIHHFVEMKYLSQCKNPNGSEYYLCGSPAMIKSMLTTLYKFDVNNENISYDEF
jgi:Na+-transporting NADH:ubiquinone oxidoreductase subunit F